MNQKYTLSILPGLPPFLSADPACLAAFAYLQLVHCPFRIKFVSDSSLLPHLPILSINSLQICGLDAIISYLKANSMDLDLPLLLHSENQDQTLQEASSPSQQDLNPGNDPIYWIHVLSTSIRNNLENAILYQLFFETENYLQSTRPALSKLLPILSRTHALFYLRTKAINRIQPLQMVYSDDQSLFPNISSLFQDTSKKQQLVFSNALPTSSSNGTQINKSNDSHVQHVGASSCRRVPLVYVKAKQTYEMLAERLRTNRCPTEKKSSANPHVFLMSKQHPSSLDAVVFGYLLLHTYPNLKDPRLNSILLFEFPELIDYVNRMKCLIGLSPHPECNLVSMPEILPTPSFSEMIFDRLSNTYTHVKNWIVYGTSETPRFTSLSTQENVLKSLRQERLQSLVYVVCAVGLFTVAGNPIYSVIKAKAVLYETFSRLFTRT